jgi:hypothetical protein
MVVQHFLLNLEYHQKNLFSMLGGTRPLIQHTLTVQMSVIQSSNQKVMSFAEIIQGRDATVRVTHDGFLYAIDLVMVMTDKSRDSAGWIIRNIPEETFPSVKITDRKMPGKGNGHTKLVSFQNAIELVMVLPGRVAKETRTQFADIIKRYLAGDHSLITEIEANAQSSSPIAQMARESLSIVTEEDLNRKRRREELELEMLQADLLERQNKAMDSQQQSVLTFINTMQLLDPNWKNDTRLVIQTKDRLKNIVLGQSPAAITNGPSDTPIYIHDVARSLGHSKLSHGDACRIGKKAAELYQARHGVAPQKRMQFVDGAERMINAYTEGDRDLLVEAVNAIMGSFN